MLRIAFLGAGLTLAGCTQQPAEPVADTPNVAVAPAAPQPATPAVVPPTLAPVAPTQPVATQTPRAEEAPVAFEYPADLGGKAVAKALAPRAPVLTATAGFGTVPKTRVLPAKVLDPDPVAKAYYVPPPILSGKSVQVVPTAPPERVPFDIGLLADGVPAKPTFPVAEGITERARDVNLPPPIPTFGRPLVERVSLDDPTAEFGNAAIVAPAVSVPVTQAGFLKVTLPDPFELGAQVKAKTPLAPEPALVPVNPERVK